MMNDFEDELDIIRAAQYEESKHLSDEDFVKKVNERGRTIAEKYGFTVVAGVNGVKQQKKKDSDVIKMSGGKQ